MAGRHTKYKAEYATDEFLNTFVSYCKKKKLLPSKVGLAVYLNVAEQTIDNWGERNDSFLGCIRKLLSIEKQMLINKGLTKQYDGRMSKFILSGCHGIIEKTETGLTGKDGGPINVAHFSYHESESN